MLNPKTKSNHVREAYRTHAQWAFAAAALAWATTTGGCVLGGDALDPFGDGSGADDAETGGAGCDEPACEESGETGEESGGAETGDPVPETCGDGVVDEGEQCDDGNGSDADACIDCKIAFCGDGHVQAGLEECDDGNEDDDDACISVYCTQARCGDGYVQAGVESCDDANDVDSDACPTTCEPASCGDGVTWIGVEDCDDANLDPDDGCTPECTATWCFSFENGDDEDLKGDNWLDPCVEAQGDTVIVRVHGDDGQLLYSASGDKVGDWTMQWLTSTAADFDQHKVSNHDRLIELDNGDHLMISGKYANNTGCGGALGDGYTIVVYPEAPNFYFNPKLIVGGYRGGMSGAPREINGWSKDHELSWADGDSMNTCNYSIQPFAARFSLEVR